MAAAEQSAREPDEKVPHDTEKKPVICVVCRESVMYQHFKLGKFKGRQCTEYKCSDKDASTHPSEVPLPSSPGPA